MATRTLDHDPDFTLSPAGNAAAGDTEPPPPEPRRAKGPIIISALVVLLLALGAYYGYRFWSSSGYIPPAPEPAVVSPAPPPEAPPAEPAIRHPIDQAPVVSEADRAVALPPLPALDESDRTALDALHAMLNGDAYLGLLVPNSVIRHIVATVDNLPRQTVATRILPLQPVPGLFGSTKSDNGEAIAAENAARYRRYMAAADSIDATRLAQLYVRLYPLFQQAYVDLGYPNGYFNDRLIEVIDHLLAAPEPKPPIYLVQPKVLYEFADPKYEQLSAGQKMMVRVGPENEQLLKAKLREIRKALVADASAKRR